MGMSIGELFVTLGVNADTMKVKDFAKAIGDTAMSTVSLVASLAGISYGLEQMLHGAIDASTELKGFNTTTGMSMQMLQKWQLVAERAAVAPEVMTQSLTKLQTLQTQILKFHEGNPMPFQFLGVDVRKGTPEQIMLNIREGLKRYSGDKSMQRELLGKMGLSTELMKIFSLSDAQVKAMGVDRLVMSDKEINNLDSLRSSLVGLRQEFERNVFKAMGDAAPQLDAVAKALMRITQAAIQLVEQYSALEAIGIVFDKMADALEYFKPGNMGLLTQTFKDEFDALNQESILSVRAGKGQLPAYMRPAMAGFGQSMGVSSILNLVQNITTSASSKETADIVLSEADRVQKNQHQRAAGQLRAGKNQ